MISNFLKGAISLSVVAAPSVSIAQSAPVVRAAASIPVARGVPPILVNSRKVKAVKQDESLLGALLPIAIIAGVVTVVATIVVVSKSSG